METICTIISLAAIGCGIITLISTIIELKQNEKYNSKLLIKNIMKNIKNES